ncbi:unnamed protein product [Brassica oleracea]|uniref:non-specific serine/threonine protein kinase n=2 Tax=Brassica TaxID=3705 RepID=A0A816V4H9_BRANA|nr:unnamed protein product [Brassica napus]
MMVVSKILEEVIEPATSALKRVLLTALRCIDPDSEKRPKMNQVVQEIKGLAGYASVNNRMQLIINPYEDQYLSLTDRLVTSPRARILASPV